MKLITLSLCLIKYIKGEVLKMEVLSLLEKKIKSLLELIEKLHLENDTLKTENNKLAKNNLQLSQQVEDLNNTIKSIEGAVVENSKDLDELSQEKA